MLVRINSHASGIVEYLQTGRKKGREFDRDLIDDRIVLAGDIQLLEASIEAIRTTQPGASKYLHITIGFAERFTTSLTPGVGEINRELMEQVTEAYRQALMVAYDDPEYIWYAEAHIPKVSHDVHASTGEAIERLPHVHIVLPKRNLADGRFLDPTGHGEQTIPYQQAIQESINMRFGLRSPLASMRAGNLANPLARHNPQFEPSSPKQLKNYLRQLVEEKKVTSFDQLRTAAETFGEVRVRQGRDGDYLNVKPSWASKGINLKELSRQAIADGLSEQPSQVAQEKAGFDKLLAEWNVRAAFEARYLTSANRKHYKALNPEEKAAWIQAHRHRSAERIRAELLPDSVVYKKESHDREQPGYVQRDHDARLVAVASYQSNLSEARRREPPESITSVQRLSSLDMVQHLESGEVLLQSDAPDRVGTRGVDGGGDAMRRPGNGDRGNGSGAGQGDGEGDGLTYIQSLRRSRKPVAFTPDQLKFDNSPALVLAAAAARFGIDPRDYDITSARDGTPRVRHQDKHYNLGDLFTKHLGVPWSTAEEVLSAAYAQTLSDTLPAPDKTLWASFNAWRTQTAAASAAARLNTTAKLAKRLADAKQTYQARKIELRSFARAKRAIELAKARADRIVSVSRARADAASERELHKAVPRNALYRAFLTQMANDGNLSALAELRRLAKPDPDMNATVTGPRSKPTFPHPNYRVDNQGRVTYTIDEKAIVTDSIKGVSVVETTANAYEIALKVAVARYGTKLTLNGDAAFMAAVLKAARNSGMNLTIRDGTNPRSAPIQINSDRNK